VDYLVKVKDIDIFSPSILANRQMAKRM
jgi:hypothetical protein